MVQAESCVRYAQHVAGDVTWPPSVKFDHGSTSWLASCLSDGCSSLGAVETDVGGTSSAAKVAFVCGL